ncbi:MAG: hypothetical protein LBS52_04820 [Dysgonamonadaceae bacterium]|jgi:hypothetical protein|nr:hypothetical protein [Dysgonamonadaceae bacterium]
MKIKLFLCGLGCCLALSAQQQTDANRWAINADGGITWTIDGRLPHRDHIEMSGEQVSVVLRYGVEADGSFALERGMVFPLLRTIPNNTHASLMRRGSWNILDYVMLNGRKPSGEKVRNITLDGVMTAESVFDNDLDFKRILFPSTKSPAFCEKYVLRNKGQKPMQVEIATSRSAIVTDPTKGVDGEYIIEYSTVGQKSCSLQPGDSIAFYATCRGYAGSQDADATLNVESELTARRALVALWRGNLRLETPDDVLNKAFDFAKIRASESIYKTKGGYLHGPGGESYYAAIWANDQAEYVNPFFPFIGYSIGNQSALNSYHHFARFMNDEYKPIPSSIIAEGIDIWNGAGDRGDAAMIAYGAARYALARGDSQEATELWTLIEWCLEYCRRQINEDGVVASNSDELEGRFPAGKANLSTSSLYYDALLSAVYLGKNLGKNVSAYTAQAKALRTAIENYFGGTVEGFNTYKYYKENDVLRSWICLPLVVGINDRKDETIRALFSPRLWTENGLLTQAGSSTFWDRSTLYALRGVFACGETEKGMEYLKFYSNRRLLGEHVPYPIEAYPEGSQRHLSAESGLYCRIITEGLFGIRPTGLRAFALTPRLPKEWDSMALRNVHGFGVQGGFDIVVTRLSGGKLRIEFISQGNKILTRTAKEGAIVQISI